MSDDTNNYSSFLPWVLTSIGIVISSLLAGLLGLFKMRETERDKQLATALEKIVVLETKVDKCELERVELFAQCKVLASDLKHQQEEIDRLKGYIESIDLKGTQHSLRTK